MDAHDGEVWAKLDAGTEAYFQLVNRTPIPFARILKNLRDCAAERPLVIQSLFLKIHDRGPSDDEITAYCTRLRDIHDAQPAPNGIRLVQVCTLARQAMTIVDGEPAWKFVNALTNAEVDAIAARVRAESGLAAESFYGH